jgi:methylmalonyl-CoA mutase
MKKQILIWNQRSNHAWNERKFSLFRHTERYLSEIAGATENTFQQLARTSGAKLYGIFKTLETVSGKVPEINKAGINEDSVLPTALELEKSGAAEDKIFLNLLLNQFEK